MNGIIQRIRVNPLDDQETNFVDIDKVLSFYLEDYRALRKKNQQNIWKEYTKLERMQGNDANTTWKISMKDFKRLMASIVPQKSPSPSVHFSREISHIRAFIYSLICGDNSNVINK